MTRIAKLMTSLFVDMNFKSKDICEMCMEFYKKYKDNESSTFCSDYVYLMNEVLKREFKIKNRQARNEIIKTLGYGGWKHLWLTDNEEKYTDKEFFQMILGEIFYCSDRWCWDRFLRTNWLYLNYISKKES